MIICTGIVADPVTDNLSVEKSKSSRFGWLRIVWKIAGGPGSMLMRSSTTRRITAGTSNTGCGTIVAPFSTHARIPALSPNAWKNGLIMR